MKVGMIGTLAVAALAVAGCGKKDDGAAATDAPKAAAKAETKAAPVDPNAVMVSVNGKTITRGKIDADVEAILKMQKAQIPPEQMDEAKKVVDDAVSDCLDHHVTDWGKIKNLIRDSLSDFMWKRMKRTPMILPIIMEVD